MDSQAGLLALGGRRPSIRKGFRALGNGSTGIGGIQHRQAEEDAPAHFGSRYGQELVGILRACTRENQGESYRKADETKLITTNVSSEAGLFPICQAGFPVRAATNILIPSFRGTHVPGFPLGQTGPVHGGGLHDQRILLA